MGCEPLSGCPLFFATKPAREVILGGAFYVEANGEPSQGNRYKNAGDECGHAGYGGKTHERHIGCSSSDGGNGVEVCALEDSGHVAHKPVPQHSAAYSGKHAHHDANKRIETVDKRLVCADCRVDANREDIEYRDNAFGFVDDSGNDVDDGGCCDGDGERERLLEDIDVSHLKGHIAQKTSSESAYNCERDSTDKVEVALAGREHTRYRGCDDGCQLKPDGDGNGLGIHGCRDHDGAANAG